MSEVGAPQEAQPPAGLGGWLTLVGLGLIASPLRLGTFLVQTFLPIFQDGTWEILTTPGNEAYHPLWAPLLIFEVLGNAVFIAAGLLLLALFFRRSSWFPTLYITYVIANLLFILVDAWLGSLVLADESMFDPDTARELFRSLLSGVIWVPYMIVSKRVRNTFVA